MPSLQRRPRRLTLFWRVLITNVIVIATAAIALVASPATLSSPATIDEIGVLAGGLFATLAVNTLLLRRWFAPLAHLREAMHDADLLDAASPLGVTGDADVAQLAAAFNDMLARLRAERLDSSRRAIAAQEGERARIARELHDEVGQSLTGLLLELDRAAGAVGERAPEIAAARESARATLEYVRLIAQQLRPVALDDLGLAPALAALGDRMGQLAAADVEHDLERALPPLTPDAELTIYRVAQEGLTNAIRHADCSRIELSLSRGEGTVVLDVRDDGRGLGDSPVGMGLRGMAERALLVDADLAVRSDAGGGTRLRLAVPAGAAA